MDKKWSYGPAPSASVSSRRRCACRNSFPDRARRVTSNPMLRAVALLTAALPLALTAAENLPSVGLPRLARTNLLVYRDAAGNVQPHVISGRNCMVVERVPGLFEMTHRDGGRPSSHVDSCLTRGITVKHHPEAHRQAVRDVTAFLPTTFAP